MPYGSCIIIIIIIIIITLVLSLCNVLHSLASYIAAFFSCVEDHDLVKRHGHWWKIPYVCMWDYSLDSLFSEHIAYGGEMLKIWVNLTLTILLHYHGITLSSILSKVLEIIPSATRIWSLHSCKKGKAMFNPLSHSLPDCDGSTVNAVALYVRPMQVLEYMLMIWKPLLRLSIRKLWTSKQEKSRNSPKEPPKMKCL